MRSLLNLFSDRLYGLPVAILNVTDRCSSRCISCDYWRHGREHMSMDLVRRLAVDLPRLGTRYVLLSGGEPLQHPQWEEISSSFKQAGLRVALATSGILLPKHASGIAVLADELFVSLDGANPESYRAIRGVDGLELVGSGVRALGGKVPITFRTVVQRANYFEMPALLRLTRSWGAAGHSFLAVDVVNRSAFGRSETFDGTLALRIEDLDPFARILDEIEKEFSGEFAEGYIAESLAGLRRIHCYFAALHGLKEFPPVRCNAPRFSAVIAADGSIKPCFFLPGYGSLTGRRLETVLNEPAAIELRRQQLGGRPECLRCVCQAYKGVREFLASSSDCFTLSGFGSLRTLESL